MKTILHAAAALAASLATASGHDIASPDSRTTRRTPR